MSNHKIMTQDEVTRSITQMIVTHFGSLEAFGEAYNEMLERSRNDTIELIVNHSIQQGKYSQVLMDELADMDEQELVNKLEELEQCI